jgi:hypothetical protein
LQDDEKVDIDIYGSVHVACGGCATGKGGHHQGDCRDRIFYEEPSMQLHADKEDEHNEH